MADTDRIEEALFARLSLLDLLAERDAMIMDLRKERDDLRHVVLRLTNENRGLYAKLEVLNGQAAKEDL